LIQGIVLDEGRIDPNFLIPHHNKDGKRHKNQMNLLFSLIRSAHKAAAGGCTHLVGPNLNRRLDWLCAIRSIALMIPLIAATGCESVRYYTHVTSGQLSIINHRQPIKKIIADPLTDPVLTHKLERILEIREFAEKDLSLPINGNYLNYVDLKRPFVAWNVGAAPEFSLVPKTWYYPIVGHASYRGYFSQEKATAFADKLRNDGFDVYVGGVTAYSTLGWFSDPVFNTIIRGSDEAAAALIFHELAHQILYVPDDTTFNESFATAVEQEGLRRWMDNNGNQTGYGEYLAQRQRREAFIALITKYRQILEELYRQDLDRQDMRQRKATVIASLKDEYETLKSTWGGYAGYDAWFDNQLNNAKLNSVGAYYDLVPAFNRLLDNQDGNLEAFYKKCRSLVDLPPLERNKRLREWHQLSATQSQRRAFLHSRTAP
jgi:predicted aminopeptidase